MFTLGLTGQMGAGKGYCCEIFARHGIKSIDTDKISRAVTEAGKPCTAELETRFGSGIIRSDGTLDRKALAAVAFADDKNVADLNAITHKYILAECRDFISERERAGDFAAIIDAPLLFESRFNYYCDFTIAVLCDEAERLERVIKRDNTTAEAALARMKRQHDEAFFRRKCDFSINNNAGQSPELQIDLIIRQIHTIP